MSRIPPRLPFPSPPPPATGPAKKYEVSHGVSRKAHRILLYGLGGIGKSTLASMSPKPIFCDLEKGSDDFPVTRVSGISSWSDLRDWLRDYDFGPYQSIVIDTVTSAEALCIKHVVENYKTDKGNSVTSIEGFGWGKGYIFVFEEWKKFLGDLERHYTNGKNIILVAHDRVGNAPNPQGEDWTRYEPRLINNRQVSIMHATKEWSDHTIFVAYDVIAVDGKGKGNGTRTIYTQEMPSFMAKSRTLEGATIIFKKGSNELWDRLLSRQNATPPIIDEGPPA